MGDLTLVNMGSGMIGVPGIRRLFGALKSTYKLTLLHKLRHSICLLSVRFAEEAKKVMKAWLR